MRGVFDDEDQDPVGHRHDTELTLGSGTLLAIFFGLVLLCGLCFGLGYALGHHGVQYAATATSSAEASQPQASGSAIKPSAAPTSPAAPLSDTATAAAVDAGQTSPLAGTSPTAGAQAIPADQYAGQGPAQPAGSIGQLQVRPAMTAGNAAAPAAQPSGGVRPALAPAGSFPSGSFLVQIAAVSNQEDADVLSSALHKRGYSVTERREPIDNLIHVRIGPFATAAEANGWKNRLLNDGYNAIVQQ